jgi:nucleotide-binding universal stress UspA family protein
VAGSASVRDVVKDGSAMKIIVWVTEGTWQASVDAARDLADGPVVLLHVIDAAAIDEAMTGARAGLLGRAIPTRVPAVPDALSAAQSVLLDAAQTRLDRPAERLGRHGQVEREVVAACADTGLLVLARDGDHTRLGPRSIGHATRFVLDHAPCRVLLVWPDEPPDLATLPPPPPRPGLHHTRPPTPPGPPGPR